MTQLDGGAQIAEVLLRRGVRFVFTLIGGHISPILVGCRRLGIQVIDVRSEVTAVFAADAVSRLSGVPGVAVVTAGPGLTNTITAVKNAQLAQSPLVVLGGATATILKGRGALQDIDQLALMKPHVKKAFAVRKVRDLAPALEAAFDVAQRGVPGPTFVECPVDLLYPEAVVRDWYVKDTAKLGHSLTARATSWFVRRHVDRSFAGSRQPRGAPQAARVEATLSVSSLRRAASMLAGARRPVLVVGSQALSLPEAAMELSEAVSRLSLPVFLAGMARGLLGRDHPRQFRRGRTAALREADLVVLAGVPCDFRLGYGMQINRQARLISVNLSVSELLRNRRPTLGLVAHPGRFLIQLSEVIRPDEVALAPWLETLRGREQAGGATCLDACERVDPLLLCHELDRVMDPSDSVLIVDGGDFVATASYIVRPTGPLSWLDPGVFGTLGVGAGFALGARLCRPEAEIWLLYGDGSLGYSLIELDTFARHGLGLVALVGNDASWAQIARDQVAILGDDVATVLARTAYHEAARGLGAEGLVIESNDQIEPALREAQIIARRGRPVLVNAMLSTTDARAGSISI